MRFNRKEITLRLKNKVAIITGSGGGIGRAVALRYAKEGAKCVVVDINGKNANLVAKEIKSFSGDVLNIEMDVREQSDIDKTINLTLKSFNKIDILFNNAGIFEMAPFFESTRESYGRIFEVNVKGMFFMMQAVASKMVEQKINGKIINLSSQAGRRGEALVSHYCASKAAVLSYTQSAALALASYRINVNGIAPGVVDTPMWETVDSLFAHYENRKIGEKKRLVGEEVPLGRMALPEDIEGAAVFLASEDANYITAQTLNVDGGNWMS
jgi:D-sorbitol dehydrogenase (acceptor)